MQSGERTVLVALRKAISLAECYIYIEEQFLWDCEIADFIVARNQELQRQKKPKLRLIVVLAAESELAANPVTRSLGEHTYHLRSRFFMNVMEITHKSQIAFGDTTGVYAYGLYQAKTKPKPIYVHSKLIIIDDRYVAIGSANVDARSMHIETELTLGIIDGDTVDGTLGTKKKAKLCKFAVELRQKLWKEHLNLSQFSVEKTHPNKVGPDAIAELKDFPGVEGNPGPWPQNEKIAKIGYSQHHVRCYVNRPGRELLTAPAARLLDREERRWRRY
jgi:phosphatidylserine/phosphatidylglycerophosphate/cardiolipin synthase-like enzyme